ncbi:MAG: hypothetical protein PWQ10_56 [Patescibacteria group bacterium]|nr:hypothetical protein [Patescibacteria group bacterium]
MGGHYKRKSQFSLSGKRPAGILDERKFFLIVTEGKTEAQYFNHFRSTTGPRILSVDKSDSKIRLVEKAIELRNKLIAEGSYDEHNDETWAVFDRDVDAKKPNDKSTFNESLALAKRNNIEVAYSNDSFELWFLLHFQVVSTTMHRKNINLKLKEHLGRYKHGDDIFSLINKNYSEAVKRAVQILKSNCKTSPVDANPSTTVHLLTEQLRKNMDC